jgi:phage terminase large subunit-like protein
VTPVLPTRAAIDAELRWRAEHKIDSYYPETGQLAREKYIKHMAFFEAGAKYNERCFMAANRIGKTEGGTLYENALHLTGRYPPWWKGRRFSRPVSVWAVGKDAKTVRDILQAALLGPGPHFGLGLLPADAILDTTPKVGTPEAVERVYVKHVSGGRSELTFKSYDSGVESFYGTKKDVIVLDEEPEQKIYAECLLRTLSTVPGDPNGAILMSYMPILGMTELTKSFMTAPEDGPKKLITATWDDAPHLSKEACAELWKSIPPHEVEARTQGRPTLGSGAVYPISEADIVVDDFKVPDYWPRAHGMDVGWNKTAAIFGAHDRDNDVAYLTSEHYRGLAEPIIHAEGIKARGAWIPGFIDPAANGRSQIDGQQLFQIYRNLGLKLQSARNAREAGIYAVWMRLSTGKLKVFRSCRNWFDEFRIFCRDENGNIIGEQKFHLMAATRYLLLGSMSRWIVKPVPKAEARPPVIGIWG